MNEIAQLVTGRSDKENAEDIRARAKEALAQIIEVMNQAETFGLRLGFNLGRDGLNRAFIQSLEVIKHL